MTTANRYTLPAFLLFSALTLTACATKPKEEAVVEPTPAPVVAEQQATSEPAPVVAEQVPAPVAMAEHPAPSRKGKPLLNAVPRSPRPTP